MAKRRSPEELVAAAAADMERAEWCVLTARASAVGMPSRFVTAMRQLPVFAEMLEWDIERLSALRGAASLVVDAYQQDADRARAERTAAQ